MKNCLALAGVLCLLASGCASSGLLGNNCGDACHVSRSKNAPRPTLFRNACLPCNGGLGLFDRKQDCDCGCADECDGACCDVCGCAAGDPCCGGRRCRERLSQMGDRCRCGVGQIASGMCPHSGGYPASYNFNPGPPTGQVAYPYYTVRGPRDFLQANPTRIGPN